MDLPAIRIQAMAPEVAMGHPSYALLCNKQSVRSHCIDQLATAQNVKCGKSAECYGHIFYG